MVGLAFRPLPRFIAIGTLASTLLLLFYTYSHYPFWKGRQSPILTPRPPRSTCPPEAYASGSWRPNNKFPESTKMTNQSDALHFSGFQGCASDREFYWHLAADHPEQWDRFPKAHSYDWHPEQGQCSLPPYDQDALVVDLVENGGWLLIGDSVTENHFFSLSCMLYPHVRATPNYTQNPYFDRAWPQNLYLNPDSPLISTMKLPVGFSIESTPLVTFRRVDLLLDGPDLEALYSSIYSPPPEFSLLSDEQFWSMPIKNYTDIFLAPLPEANYRTLVISTAGHWTTTVFSGLADETKVGNGIDEVLRFFTHAMEKWADEVQAILTEHGSRNKDVVVRAYLPGHDDCHDIRAPWDTILPYKREIYNWNWIHNFNEIFQNILSSPSYTDIHFLPIDVPARLRPDAHSAGDCLHIMTGAGIMEGWSHYIWHFISRELPGRMR